MNKSLSLIGLFLVLLLPVQSWAAVSTTTTSGFKTGTGNGTSGAVTEPTSCVSGDMLFAYAHIDGSASGLTRPASWTNLANGQSPFDGQFDYDISYISRGGSAPSLTWTWTGNVYYEVHVICVHTDDAGTVTLDTNAAVLTSGSNAALNGSPVTVSANSLVAVGFVDWSGSASGGWTAPTNYTIRSTNTVGLNGGIIARTALVTGTEDPGTITNGTGSSSNSVSMTVAFNETGGGGGSTCRGGLLLMGVGRC